MPLKPLVETFGRRFILENQPDAQLAEGIRSDDVQGDGYDEGLNTPCPAIAWRTDTHPARPERKY